MKEEVKNKGMNNLVFKHKCSKCENEILIIPERIKKVKVRDSFRNQLTLTIYECNKCGKVYYCQLDNFTTEKLLESLQSLFAKIIGCKKEKGYTDKILQNKYKKLTSKLTNERNKLMKKYTGKILSSEEKIYEIDSFINV